LIVHAPGQLTGKRVQVTADETSLPPTILDLAGLYKPEWMHGESLVEWLNGEGQGAHEGHAFTLFLEKNSTFQPCSTAQSE
jgi:hypothetical protein